MAIGYESSVINGQLVNVAPKQGYSPLTFGSMYTGPGFWPRNGVYNVPPVLPSPGTWAGSTGASTSAAESMGGGMVPTAGSMSEDGRMNYFHPTKSPLIWAVGFLGIGLWMLHSIHYK